MAEEKKGSSLEDDLKLVFKFLEPLETMAEQRVIRGQKSLPCGYQLILAKQKDLIGFKYCYVLSPEGKEHIVYSSTSFHDNYFSDNVADIVTKALIEQGYIEKPVFL